MKLAGNVREAHTFSASSPLPPTTTPASGEFRISSKVNLHLSSGFISPCLLIRLLHSHLVSPFQLDSSSTNTSSPIFKGNKKRELSLVLLSPKLAPSLCTFFNCQILKKHFCVHCCACLISTFFNTSPSAFWSHSSTESSLTASYASLSKPLVSAAFITGKALPGPNILK